MKYLVGVDLGTSGTKTVLFDENGRTITSSLIEYPMYQPKGGWAEQDPEDWWNATYKSIKEVVGKCNVESSDIVGLGISGQMHGLVLLDSDNKVLRKSIIWCDQRSYKECDELTEMIGAKRLIEITANPALTGFTASKILWVKNNEPEIFKKVSKILLPKDYIRYMLTGDFATEVSDASGMQLLDVPNRKWSIEILDKIGIKVDMLGKVYESCEVTGNISKYAAKISGLKEGTIVVGGAGDQAAGAIGNGIVKKGIISSTIGTSGVVFAHADEVKIDMKGRVHTFCHAVPGKWHIMGVTQSAGLSLQWFRNNFCEIEVLKAKEKEIDPYIIMDNEAAKIDEGSEGLYYLPYLMGERTPHLDPFAKGVFFGLTAKHTKAHFIRAIMEGVTYSLMDCLSIIKDMGLEINEVRASGGGGKSELWKEMQANLFGINIDTINSSEGPALGVAILAGVGAGIYSCVEEACEKMIKVVETKTFDEKSYENYQKFYKLYRKLYYSLRDNYKELNEILN